MKELVITLVSLFIYYTNLKFFKSLFIYLPIIVLVIYVSLKIEKRKYPYRRTLSILLKILMVYSVMVGIFGYFITYANTNMQGFDHQQKIDAFITGLRNFGLCVLCYILLLFSKKDYKK